MEPKYTFTGETRKFCGRTLHRIGAVRNFGDVKKGDRGGWVQSMKNLSHANDCWIYDNATVCGNAKVEGHAKIKNNGAVFHNARVNGWASVTDFAEILENAWVSDRAIIAEHAVITNSAKIHDDAIIKGWTWVNGNANISWFARIENRDDYISISNVGTENNETITFYKTLTGEVIVNTKHFQGNLKEFESLIEEINRDDKYIREYRLAVELAKTRLLGGE